MNPGLFVIEHFLGPERSRTRLHVKILAGVDKSGVQFGSEDGRRNVTVVGTVAAAAFRFPVEIAIVPEDHQAKNFCGGGVIKIIETLFDQCFIANSMMLLPIMDNS